MFFSKDSIWPAGLKASGYGPIARIVGYENERLWFGRVLDLRWSQETDHWLTVILIGPYSHSRMSNREIQVSYILPGCRSYWPLLFEMNALQQVKLDGRQSLGTRLPKTVTNSPRSLGEIRTGREANGAWATWATICDSSSCVASRPDSMSSTMRASMSITIHCGIRRMPLHERM